MITFMHQISRAQKRLVLLLMDAGLLCFALWLAIAIRMGDFSLFYAEKALWFGLAPVLSWPIFIRLGMYRAVIQYMELQALGTVFMAVSLSVLLFATVLLLLDPYGIPRSSVLVYWAFALLFIAGSRVFLRWLLQAHASGKVMAKCPVLIYGAGRSGAQLALAMKCSTKMRAVAFIDDDCALHKQQIAGLAVYRHEQLPFLIQRYGVEQVLLAMSSISKERRRVLFDRLAPYPVKVKVLPSISELAQKDIQLDSIRDVSVEDLLGRDAVAPNQALLQKNISDRVVMVTGAGGSIGSEICRQVLKQKPKCLLLFERNEFALYTIHKELDAIKESVVLLPLLGSVMHQRRLEHIIQRFSVQTMYHAAAYKHVPLVEYNPIEGVLNNVLGTWHAATAAKNCGVSTFVLISTDKAVRPTNVMGASKRLAELGVQALASESSETTFCMVRFGNVLGSSGSVVPVFKEQIKKGGPVTVTHAEITRYFMTIPEASQLVIQAGAMAKGGDVFVLDMGDPVRIMDLAEKNILLSGLTVKNTEHPDGDIEIVCTGLRPGEKLYEELLIGENVTGTEHHLIMRAEEEMLSLQAIQQLERELFELAQNFDVEGLRACLLNNVSGYQPQCGIQDVVFQAASDPPSS